MGRRIAMTGRGRTAAQVAGAGITVLLLAALSAASPLAGIVAVLALFVVSLAASYWQVTGRLAGRVAAALALAFLLVMAALHPPVAAIAAAAMWVGAIIAGDTRSPRAAARRLVRVIGLPLAVALAVATSAGVLAAIALWPGYSILAAAGVLVLACAWRARATIAPVVLAVAGVIAVAGLTAGLALYPATILLAVIVLAIVVLARRSPALALGAAVLLFEFEGSVKILLGLYDPPLPGGSRAAGAAALDLALLAAIAGVLIRDRLRAPMALWASATRGERIVIGLIGAWLALSVLQVAQGGDLLRGVHGFRLFQWYSLVALATLTVFSHPRLRSAALGAGLAIGVVVSLYAALRVAIGPADAERAFATAVPTVTTYGNTLRAVGSFSSAIGLSSFLTPVAVFALVLGLLLPRVRALSWTLAVVALVGLIGSFSRTSLFGVALGLVGGLVLAFFAGRASTRRRFAAAGLVVVMLAGTYGGLWVASRTSPQLRERAAGVLDPLGDESVKLRFKTWERNIDDVAAHPLGQGVGAVGAASAADVRQVRTTDNSFLKVLVEQGFLGLALFVTGLLGAVVVLVRRLRSAPDDLRPVGVAALSGFVAFLGISFAGESVEQPGKVVAWALLGIAAAYAFGDLRSRGEAV